MKIQYAQYQQKGTEHSKEMGCQDVVLASYRDGVAGISLADGAGSYSYAKEGARAVCEQIHSYMSENFARFSIADDNRHMAGFIMQDIRHRLCVLAQEYDSPVEEFASTLLYSGTDGNNIIFLHLGDGAVLGTRWRSPYMISKPENGSCHRYTYLTTSPSAAEHLRIFVAQRRFFDSVTLCSDGFPMDEYHYLLCEEDYDKSQLFYYATETAAAMTQKRNPSDDASFITMFIS